MRTEVVKYVKKKRGLYAADGGDVPNFVDQSSENGDTPAIDVNADTDVMSADPNKNYVEQSSQNDPAKDDGKKKKKAADDSQPVPDSPKFRISAMSPISLRIPPTLNAADGGEAPNFVDQSSENGDTPAIDVNADDEPESNDAPVAKPDAAPADDPAAPDPSPDDAKQQAIKDYLEKQYGQAADDSGIKAAVAEQHHQNMIANLGEGLHEMVTSRAVANGAAPDSGKFFQGIRDQGKAGVDQAMGARQQAIQGFLQKNALNRQVIQDQMTKGTYDNQQAAAKAAQSLNDPTSPHSLGMQPLFQKLWSKQLAGADVSNLSANQMDDLGKQFEHKSATDQAGMTAQLRADALKFGAQAHADAMQSNLQNRQAYADDRSDKKTAATQSAKMLEMENKGMGGRGAPQYISQNMRTQQSIKNANKMLDELPKDATGQSDYDKMNDKQIHLFNAELERIASNGAPTESGRNAMEADTLKSKWQEFKQKFVGNPLPADVGNFVRQNAKYLRDLKDSVDSTVNGFRRENYDNYAGINAISAKDAETYRGKHPELFPEENGTPAAPDKPAAAPQVGGPGMAVGAPAGQSPADGMVKIQDPKTGETRMVPPDAVSKYLKKGGKVVN